MSDARLQHQLDLVTRECQEWKTRATSAEAERDDLAARLRVCNDGKMGLLARFRTAMKVVDAARKYKSTWDIEAYDTMMDALAAFDAATKAG